MNPEGTTTPLGMMLSLMIESGISNHPHPSIASIYFEVVNRYSGFFEKHSNYLPIALQSFLDARGLFHRVKSVRLRTNYLFLKFVKSMKKFLVPYVEGMLTVLQVCFFLNRAVCSTYFPYFLQGAACCSASFYSDCRGHFKDWRL